MLDIDLGSSRWPEPVLFMTWARRNAVPNGPFLEAVAGAYLEIGRQLGVEVAPVGPAFAEAERRLMTLALHYWDGTHPSAVGSYWRRSSSMRR